SDLSGNIITTGGYSATTNLGGTTLTAKGAGYIFGGDADCFRAKYAAADGAHSYSYGMGSTDVATGKGQIDVAGYIAHNRGGIGFDYVIVSSVTDVTEYPNIQTMQADYGRTKQGIGGNNIVALYDSAGTNLVLNMYGDGSGGKLSRGPTGVSVQTVNGDIAVCGYAAAGLYIGYINGQNVFLTTSRYFILTIDSTGLYKWGRGATGLGTPYAVAHDNSGFVY